MNEHRDTNADARHAAAGREVLLMSAGGLAFAVYADECECVTPWAEPAPLPHAPAAVLGVVLVRGRMRTVLDPARLFDARAASTAPAPRAFVASLAGDEQLALALDTYGPASLVADEELSAPASPAPPARATFRRDGRTVHLLDPARLFDAAMTGTERRRQRTPATDHRP